MQYERDGTLYFIDPEGNMCIYNLDNIDTFTVYDRNGHSVQCHKQKVIHYFHRTNSQCIFCHEFMCIFRESRGKQVCIAVKIVTEEEKKTVIKRRIENASGMQGDEITITSGATVVIKELAALRFYGDSLILTAETISGPFYDMQTGCMIPIGYDRLCVKLRDGNQYKYLHMDRNEQWRLTTKSGTVSINSPIPHGYHRSGERKITEDLACIMTYDGDEMCRNFFIDNNLNIIHDTGDFPLRMVNYHGNSSGLLYEVLQDMLYAMVDKKCKIPVHIGHPLGHYKTERVGGIVIIYDYKRPYIKLIYLTNAIGVQMFKETKRHVYTDVIISLTA